MQDGTQTEGQPGMTTRLMDALIPLGASLPESHKPAPATLSHLLAGLLYWLETGSTELPEREPDAEPIVTTSKDAEIAALKAELESARNAAAAKPVAASPVAPAPTATPVTAGVTAADLSPTDPVATPPAVAQPGEDSTPPPAAVPVPPVSDVPSAPAS